MCFIVAATSAAALESIDIVFPSGPPYSDPTVAVGAAAGGKHVLVQTDFTRKIVQSVRRKAAAQVSGIVTDCDFFGLDSSMQQHGKAMPAP